MLERTAEARRVHDEDPALEERTWRAQRIALLGASVYLSAAVAGVFGHGPLSAADVTSADGSLRVEYARFMRVGDPVELRATARLVGPMGSVWLDRGALEGVRIRSVDPEPVRTEVFDDRTALMFDAPERARAAEVVILLEAVRAGAREGAIGVGAAPSEESAVRLRSFVYR